MKIYTKRGDKGQTQLIGGDKVFKNHLRIEAYGTVDELNSHLGLIRDAVKNESLQEFLKIIQDDLFTIGSHLATSPGSNFKLPVLSDSSISEMEKQMDEFTAVLPELRSFILPGGNLESSYCQIGRSVCRRAERKVVELSQHEQVEPVIIQYLNRLSDFLFVLARKVLHDSGCEEIKWTPRNS